MNGSTDVKDMAVGLTLAGVGLILLTVLTLTPTSGAKQVAAIFPPWQSQSDILAELSDLPYRLVRPGWSDTVLILDVSEAPDMRGELAERALFLADALVFGWCWSEPSG